jgi:serine/threonine protein kinase/class 3 adenylate cyclase
MGAVYRGEDMTDGSPVALKVLGSRSSTQPDALIRLLKEARLLAEVNNPYVANLQEVNEDEGVYYLVMEFVPGCSLARYLVEHGKMDEPSALEVMADVARALLDAHERGIVHRDVKPENILLLEAETGAGQRNPGASNGPRAKLTDFGLARHVVESESLNVTRAGAILGTPLYMAPEQCSGHGAVDARSDVYAMGATLFHLLAGQPPFLADSPIRLIAMHANDPPPSLKQLNPALSDGVCQIVGKSLAKHPDSRYASAGMLLRDLERLLRGEPTSIAVHPKLPECDPRNLVEFDFRWELESAPEQLWSYVSNTERLNRAIGLQAPEFSSEIDAGSGRVRRFAKVRAAGMSITWEEHPFEWVEARRFGVLREFSQGPFRWYVSTVALEARPSGGTTLTHRLRIEPRGLLGRTVAAVEVGIRARRSLDRVYRRIDAVLAGKLGRDATLDAFEVPAALSSARRRRLDQLIDRLVVCQVPPSVAEQLGEFLRLAPDQEVARIRPLALAARLRLDPHQLVAACLRGAHEGMLQLLWDILCPICRIPSEVRGTLQELSEHGRCEACNLDFELDFANSVEMIFRAHPEIRDVQIGTYCIGGPSHSPHVAAQARLQAGERIELELALGEGEYRVRGPQLPRAYLFRVQAGAGVAHWELNLKRPPDPELIPRLKSGRQVIAITNDYAQELLVRVERTASRHDALTAARAASLTLFRELFPGEILSPGKLVSVATITLLITELEGAASMYLDLGDAKAFGLLHEHFRIVSERIRAEGGVVLKTVGEGLVAAFHDPVAAVRAGLDLPSQLGREPATSNLRLRLSVHRGPAMVATLNDQLDYFGSTVKLAEGLIGLARGSELVLSASLASDPRVAQVLEFSGYPSELVQASLPGQPNLLVHRVALAPAPTVHGCPPEGGPSL